MWARIGINSKDLKYPSTAVDGIKAAFEIGFVERT